MGKKFPLLENHPDRLWGSPKLPVQWVPRFLSGVKRSEREFDHLCLYAVQVKNEWSFSSAGALCHHGVDRRNCTSQGIFSSVQFTPACAFGFYDRHFARIHETCCDCVLHVTPCGYHGGSVHIVPPFGEIFCTASTDSKLKFITDHAE